MPTKNALFGNAEILTLSEAAAMLPGQPHLSTIIRWAQRGCNGRKLPTIRVGSRSYVKKSELLLFVEPNVTADTASTRTPQQRQRAVAKAKASLKKAGVSK